MRYLSSLAIVAALVGGALAVSSLPAAAAPNSGAAALATQTSDQADTLFVQIQQRKGVAPVNRGGGRTFSGGNRGGRGVAGGGNRGGRVANTGGRGGRSGGGGGGGGGGGFGAAMMGLGIAADIMSGIQEAEEAQQVQAQEAGEDAIAACARRFRSYDPQTQTYIGRGRRVYRCP